MKVNVPSRFQVMVRVRPILYLDEEDGEMNNCVSISKEQNRIVLNKKGEQRVFRFDQVFDPEDTQEDVFQTLGKPLLENVFQGVNSTMIAYGQSGSGKSYTIFGPPQSTASLRSKRIDKEVGLLYRSLHYVFETIYDQLQTKQFHFSMAVMQLYNEQILDNLEDSQQQLYLREDPNTGIYVEGLNWISVTNLDDAVKVIHSAAQNRVIRETNANQMSSRSHTFIQFLIEQRWTSEKEITDEPQLNVKTVRVSHNLSGLFTIADLAGSERHYRKVPSQEGKFINKSIATLSNCIQQLWNDGKKIKFNNYPPKHIPFRESKLTRLLQQSISGQQPTTFCICIKSTNFEESFQSLIFGHRAMMIHVNTQPNEELYFKIVDKEQEESVLRIPQIEGIFTTNPSKATLTKSPSQTQHFTSQSDDQKQELNILPTSFTNNVQNQDVKQYLDIISYLQRKLVKKNLEIDRLKKLLGK